MPEIANIKPGIRGWLVVLTMITTVPTLSAADSSPIPKQFRAYIGGFMGSSYQLELHDGVLTYTAFGGGHSNPKQTAITPTTEQWREFRQALDAVKVWKWRTNYPNGGTVDGTQWSLEIAYKDHTIKTHGDNSYPDSTGKASDDPEPTKAFNLYLDAVKRLIEKTFQ